VLSVYEFVNHLACEGWELVTGFPQGPGKAVILMVFKRPKQ
jgi:hypothetical protein